MAFSPTIRPPVLHYKMQETDTSSVKVNDAGSIPSYGDRTNAPSINQTGPTGIITKSYDFTAASSQYIILNSINLDWSAGITICFWCYYDGGTGSYPAIFQLYDGGTGVVDISEVAASGYLRFRTTSVDDITTSVVFPTSEWSFIVCKTNGSANGCYVYYDMSEEFNGTLAVPNSVNYATTRFIGGVTGLGSMYDGKLADLRFYNYDLALWEISNLWNQGNGTLL